MLEQLVWVRAAASMLMDIRVLVVDVREEKIYMCVDVYPIINFSKMVINPIIQRHLKIVLFCAVHDLRWF